MGNTKCCHVQDDKDLTAIGDCPAVSTEAPRQDVLDTSVPAWWVLQNLRRIQHGRTKDTSTAPDPASSRSTHSANGEDEVQNAPFSKVVLAQTQQERFGADADGNVQDWVKFESAVEAVPLSDLKGLSMEVLEGAWTIGGGHHWIVASDGRALFDGKYWGSEFDVSFENSNLEIEGAPTETSGCREKDGSRRPPSFKRDDGWEVHMEMSTLVLLVWRHRRDVGKQSVNWRRLQVTPPAAATANGDGVAASKLPAVPNEAAPADEIRKPAAWQAPRHHSEPSGIGLRQPIDDIIVMFPRSISDVTGILPRTELDETCDNLREEVLKSIAEKFPATLTRFCGSCGVVKEELFLDPTDRKRYCESCWIHFYGQSPWQGANGPLVPVEVVQVMPEETLEDLWAETELPGWPPVPKKKKQDLVGSAPTSPKPGGGRKKQPANRDGEWTYMSIRVHRDIVGPSAREQTGLDRPLVGELLCNRYKISHMIGEGHFTKAFLAEDTERGEKVCVKRFNKGCTFDQIADLIVLGKRLQDVDPNGANFPHFHDAFFDLAGFFVESLIEGKNCHVLQQADPSFFEDLGNLSHVARGVCRGLSLLERAGIVHNDLKPDNIIWVDTPKTRSVPSVRIVDFGCARLDERTDGRNWNMAEGGAGHIGYASPEMALGLPITHQGDIWSLAVLTCELHCGRSVWYSEALTPEEILAQALGLCDLQEGLPSSLLRLSPLDIRLFYTPAFTMLRGHLPVCKASNRFVEVLAPKRYGLDQVLGEDWQAKGKGDLRDFLVAALEVDHARRPSANQLLQRCRFVKITPPGAPSSGPRRAVATSATHKSNAPPPSAGAAAPVAADAKTSKKKQPGAAAPPQRPAPTPAPATDEVATQKRRRSKEAAGLFPPPLEQEGSDGSQPPKAKADPTRPKQRPPH